MPAFRAGTATSQSYVQFDTLRLSGDGTFSDSDGLRNVFYSPAEGSRPADSAAVYLTATAQGTWDARGDSVTLRYGPDANRYGTGLANPGPISGRLTADGCLAQARSAQIGTEDYVWCRP